MTQQLTAASVVAHLCDRGLLADAGPDRGVSVTTLAGGVSGATFLVTGGPERYVVKQPLPFLSVADEWPARQERAGVEAAAIHLLERLTPGHLPRLLDYDPEGFVIVMSAAPASWSEWRTSLLAGQVLASAAGTLGTVLGRWHAATRADAEALAAFADLTGFVELRGDPYHRTVAARRPDLAAPVTRCLAELLETQICVVHGDFSPKNVLVGVPGVACAAGAGAGERPGADSGAADDGLWVLDFEVAHAGNPVFDVAFMLHHLVMKAVHLPAAAEPLRACVTAFLDHYAGAGGLATDEESVVRHTGALLLARVHGKSPTAYLTPAEAERISALGARAVRGEVEHVTTLLAT